MSYEARLRHVLDIFGIKHTAHLPADGATARTVRLPIRGDTLNVLVWIVPAVAAPVVNGRLWKSSKHRIMCYCPKCGAEMSAGRLHQHYYTMKCLRRAWRRDEIAAREDLRSALRRWHSLSH